MEDLIIVIVGMAFVLLGVFQYMQEQDKKSDKRRQELFAELEQAKLKIVRLQGDLAKEKRLKIEARTQALRYYKMLKKR